MAAAGDYRWRHSKRCHQQHGLDAGADTAGQDAGPEGGNVPDTHLVGQQEVLLGNGGTSYAVGGGKEQY